MLNIQTEERLAAAIKAIHSGDLDALKKLLSENPGLANVSSIVRRINVELADSPRTLLHAATDGPGSGIRAVEAPRQPARV